MSSPDKSLERVIKSMEAALAKTPSLELVQAYLSLLDRQEKGTPSADMEARLSDVESRLSLVETVTDVHSSLDPVPRKSM